MNRIADRIDLAIDVLTLGQYGLEKRPAYDVADCEGIGRLTGWETFPVRSRQSPGRARRVACERPRSSTSSASCQ